MNLFWLDYDHDTNARYHVDKHIVKMPLEVAQLLCTAHHVHPTEYVAPYKMTHVNHPCAVYARRSAYSYLLTAAYGLALCREYTHRYNKHHACEQIIQDLYDNLPALFTGTTLPIPPLCMPDQYKIKDDVVQSYRNYYIGAKSDLFSWKKRSKPEWIP